MKTRDIKKQLVAKIEKLRMISDADRNNAISEIVDSLLSSAVAVRCCVAELIGSPVPNHDRERDGDYAAFLVTHNCD